MCENGHKNRVEKHRFGLQNFESGAKDQQAREHDKKSRCEKTRSIFSDLVLKAENSAHTSFDGVSDTSDEELPPRKKLLMAWKGEERSDLLGESGGASG
jgi:hypothetical protein